MVARWLDVLQMWNFVIVSAVFIGACIYVGRLGYHNFAFKRSLQPDGDEMLAGLTRQLYDLPDRFTLENSAVLVDVLCLASETLAEARSPAVQQWSPVLLKASIVMNILLQQQSVTLAGYLYTDLVHDLGMITKRLSDHAYRRAHRNLLALERKLEHRLRNIPAEMWVFRNILTRDNVAFSAPRELEALIDGSLAFSPSLQDVI